ncbi:hypothetical protein L2E82_20635 [Cichorium intybus]|uniref:Uncharacterized protein n=1 Tax=Cichorium intybus TaxID=13427 RepID=A0ACB9DUW2_CICIN|nr:hypothetical protein L2E82_20635 [Cichorium intybus]
MSKVQLMIVLNQAVGVMKFLLPEVEVERRVEPGSRSANPVSGLGRLCAGGIEKCKSGRWSRKKALSGVVGFEGRRSVIEGRRSVLSTCRWSLPLVFDVGFEQVVGALEVDRWLEPGG